MRGNDIHQSVMFSYLSPEERVPGNHPLRAVRTMTEAILKQLSSRFEKMYSRMGRPSIGPEKLLRALLLQVFYTIRSERLRREQLNYNLLFRWFKGRNMDEEVWVPTVFSKNRDRLLDAGEQRTQDDPGNPTVDHGEKRSNKTHASTTDREFPASLRDCGSV